MRTKTTDVELIDAWDRHLEAQGVSEDQRLRRRFGLLKFLIEIAPRTLEDVSPAEVRRFLASIVMPVITTWYEDLLRSFTAWAEEHGHAVR